ncbi:MAG: Mut7-C RNAse domain-containing protein [Chloroflexota bacterium]|nr:Mut7-C RNAse domain-containing protein [Chloroflexota bacterium]
MKFLVDNMLGRLATWLRLLGYDTAYLPEADDHALARVARAEDRILLTRDVELTRRRGVRHVLIESEKVEEQLGQIFRTLGLSARQAFSRCAECNTILEQAKPESVRGHVPPYVFQTHARFLRCPRCQRVYWRGTHWAHMLAQIEELERF